MPWSWPNLLFTIPSITGRSSYLQPLEKIENPKDKKDAFEWLTNKMVPGSWDYLRPVKENEISKTIALAFPLHEASAKIRTGMPVDDEEDQELSIWSGLIPLQSRRLTPITDEFSKHIPSRHI